MNINNKKKISRYVSKFVSHIFIYETHLRAIKITLYLLYKIFQFDVWPIGKLLIQIFKLRELLNKHSQLNIPSIKRFK